jgi:sugar transferase (PEP-CTERM system associated)
MVKIGGQKVASRVLWLLLCDAEVVVVAVLVAEVLPSLWSTGHFSGFDGFRTFLRFAVVVVVCILSLHYNDLYDCQILRQQSKLFFRLLKALSIACAGIALVYYVFPILSLERTEAAIAAPIMISFMLSARLIIERTGALKQRPERVLILGTDAAGIALTRETLKRSELAMDVVGFLDEKGEGVEKSLVNPGIIGGVAEVRRIVGTHKIDRIVLALSERRGTMPVDDLLRLKLEGIRIEDAHTCYERLIGRILLERLAPSSFILSDGFRKSQFLVVAKRWLDIIVALIGIALTWPLMGAAALAIWMETGRPVLFRQKRVGLNGKEFEILKFRSMRKDAEAGGPAWATATDSRITRVGSFLRKYRLDELPQLITVLRGDMSLVGPRPEQPYFCKLLLQNIPYFEQRHSVRPGITGWAQVNYHYGSTVNESKIKFELDLFYIKHLSVFLDLAILFQTGKIMLIGRGAQ